MRGRADIMTMRTVSPLWADPEHHHPEHPERDWYLLFVLKQPRQQDHHGAF